MELRLVGDEGVSSYEGYCLRSRKHFDSPARDCRVFGIENDIVIGIGNEVVLRRQYKTTRDYLDVDEALYHASRAGEITLSDVARFVELLKEHRKKKILS